MGILKKNCCQECKLFCQTILLLGVRSLDPEPVYWGSNPTSATWQLSHRTHLLASLNFCFLLCKTGMVTVPTQRGNFGKSSELLHMVFGTVPGLQWSSTTDVTGRHYQGSKQF